MCTYTIKKRENDALLLLDQQGTVHPLTDVLAKVAPCRVLAFEGKMGAGKTTFIKQLCEELGTDDVVNSPTFAIVNVYDVKDTRYTDNEVYHFDCYRLKDIREAMDFGAEEYLYSGNLCLIEWPDIIAPLLPEDTVYLQITEKENGDRLLTINC